MSKNVAFLLEVIDTWNELDMEVVQDSIIHDFQTQLNKENMETKQHELNYFNPSYCNWVLFEYSKNLQSYTQKIHYMKNNMVQYTKTSIRHMKIDNRNSIFMLPPYPYGTLPTHGLHPFLLLILNSTHFFWNTHSLILSSMEVRRCVPSSYMILVWMRFSVSSSSFCLSSCTLYLASSTLRSFPPSCGPKWAQVSEK